MLVPGQTMPAEGEEPGSTSSSTSSPSATTSSAGGSGASGLSGGAIAGIVVGIVAFVAILVALFFVLGRNRVYQKWMSSQDGRQERTARWALWSNSGDPWVSHRSEMDSSTQPPGDQPMSPDPKGPVSPHPSGHWSWQFQQQPSYHQPAPLAPSELEATTAVKHN